MTDLEGTVKTAAKLAARLPQKTLLLYCWPGGSNLTDYESAVANTRLAAVRLGALVRSLTSVWVCNLTF